VDSEQGFFLPIHRPELNELAFQLDVATSQEGKRLAALYKSGKWPVLMIQAALRPASVLKLSGIAMGQTPTAVINGRPLSVGDTATIPSKPQNVVVKCLRIDNDAVLVSVEGEATPRELRLK